MAARLSTLPPGVLLMSGLAGSVLLRFGLAGTDGAGSVGAALVFALALWGLAAAAGWRPKLTSIPALAVGVLGAAVLAAFPLLSRGAWQLPAVPLPLAAFAVWAPLVTAVAVTEEIVLRGVLFTRIQTAVGPLAALALTSLAFALMHVPFYGWGAFPLDLAAGVWLGALRVLTGGVAAPATAHALTDLATWWLV